MANILATDINNKRTTLVNYGTAKSNTLPTTTAVTAGNKVIVSNYTQIAAAINSLEGAWSGNCCESNHCQSCQSDKNQSCQQTCTNCTSKNQSCQNTCTCQSSKDQSCQDSCTNCTNKNQSCQNACANCTTKNQACQSATNQGCQGCQNSCTNQSCQNSCACQSCQTNASKLLKQATLLSGSYTSSSNFFTNIYSGRNPRYFGLQNTAGSSANTDFLCQVGTWYYTVFTYYGDRGTDRYPGFVFFYSTTTSDRSDSSKWIWSGDAMYSWFGNVGDRNNPVYTSNTNNMNFGYKWKGVFQTLADMRSVTQWRIACALHYNFNHG